MAVIQILSKKFFCVYAFPLCPSCNSWYQCYEKQGCSTWKRYYMWTFSSLLMSLTLLSTCGYSWMFTRRITCSKLRESHITLTAEVKLKALMVQSSLWELCVCPVTREGGMSWLQDWLNCNTQAKYLLLNVVNIVLLSGVILFKVLCSPFPSWILKCLSWQGLYAVPWSAFVNLRFCSFQQDC